ncbi:MAG TPA: hypothetical protein VHC22_24495 [Pirellulales bacterium]|nr:hypothetical protein [Pirellulales bacterium]
MATDTLDAPTARVDRANGIIRGVKILGFQSRAPGIVIGCTPEQYGAAAYETYSYAPDAVARAIPLYEGIKVYLDHPGFSYLDDGERVPSLRDRTVQEVFGRLVRCRMGDGGLFGDLEYITSHPAADQIAETSEKYPELLAFSHNADGDPKLINGRIVIVNINSVRSVDLVGEKAGTTNGLFESEPNMSRAITKRARVAITHPELFRWARSSNPTVSQAAQATIHFVAESAPGDLKIPKRKPAAVRQPKRQPQQPQRKSTLAMTPDELWDVFACGKAPLVETAPPVKAPPKKLLAMTSEELWSRYSGR